jgi:hypothetical protein
MNEKFRIDRKANRRKIRNKMQTLVKKAVEISGYECDVLVVIHWRESKHWIQYCSEQAESLFFGFQNAKKHLQTAEEFNNMNYDKFSASIGVVDDSVSPPPVKLLKTRENFSDTQTIKTAGFEKLESKMGKSAISTDFTSTAGPDIFPPKLDTKPPDNKPESFIFEDKPLTVEENSSPDFDFETYFSANS